MKSAFSLALVSAFLPLLAQADTTSFTKGLVKGQRVMTALTDPAYPQKPMYCVANGRRFTPQWQVTKSVRDGQEEFTLSLGNGKEFRHIPLNKNFEIPAKRWRLPGVGQNEAFFLDVVTIPLVDSTPMPRIGEPDWEKKEWDSLVLAFTADGLFGLYYVRQNYRDTGAGTALFSEVGELDVATTHTFMSCEPGPRPAPEAEGGFVERLGMAMEIWGIVEPLLPLLAL